MPSVQRNYSEWQRPHPANDGHRFMFQPTQNDLTLHRNDCRQALTYFNEAWQRFYMFEEAILSAFAISRRVARCNDCKPMIRTRP